MTKNKTELTDQINDEEELFDKQNDRLKILKKELKEKNKELDLREQLLKNQLDSITEEYESLEKKKIYSLNEEKSENQQEILEIALEKKQELKEAETELSEAKEEYSQASIFLNSLKNQEIKNNDLIELGENAVKVKFGEIGGLEDKINRLENDLQSLEKPGIETPKIIGQINKAQQNLRDEATKIEQDGLNEIEKLTRQRDALKESVLKQENLIKEQRNKLDILYMQFDKLQNEPKLPDKQKVFKDTPENPDKEDSYARIVENIRQRKHANQLKRQNKEIEPPKGPSLAEELKIVQLDKAELLKIAKEAAIHGENNPQLFKKLEESLGDDKNLNAEIILEATKNLNFDDNKTNNYIFNKFNNLYNEKVRGQDNKPKLEEFDKIFEKLPPKDLGKLLFRENYSKQPLQALVKNQHLSKLEKATSVLQANVQKNDSSLLVLSSQERATAVNNLRDNLSLKQMSKVVATMEGYEDYSQKNWLSKALSKFVDTVRRKFSALKTQGVEKGIQELLQKGAGIETKEIAGKKVHDVKQPKQKVGHSRR